MKTITSLIVAFFFISLLQAQETYIKTSDGVDLYVNVKGKGTPCLYIHGGPGSGSYWLEKFAGDSLEQHFQMIYLDQRGVGRSTSPKDQNYSMDRMVKDFEEVRISLGIKQWLTMGHSFGGILQMGYVTSKPSSVIGLLFINCSLSMNESFENSWLPKALELAGNDTPAVCYDKSVPIYKRMGAVVPVLNKKGVFWKIFYANEENSRKMNDTYWSFKSWNNDQSNIIMEISEYWKDYRVSSEEVKQPVLFYYGRTDWSVGPEHYKGVKFPSMLLLGSNAGHMPFMESKEDLMKAINRFQRLYKF